MEVQIMIWLTHCEIMYIVNKTAELQSGLKHCKTMYNVTSVSQKPAASVFTVGSSDG